MLSVAAAVILIALASASDHWCPEDIDPPDDLALDVAKCCFKGQQLDATGEKCVERAGSPTELTQWEALGGAPAAYWLPPSLARRAGVRAWYNHSCTFHKWLSAVVPLPNDTSAQLVEAFLRVNASAHRFELSPFGGRVRAFSVWKQSYCFDATADGARPLALVTTLQLRTLFKCCAGGKQLDARGERCVARPGERASDAETDVLSPWERPGALYWLPRRLADSVVEVSYDKGPAPSDNPKSDADDEHWELMETANWAFKVRRHPQASTNVTDTNHSALANGPDGVTGSYCFDAAEQGGALPPRVLVTKVAKVNKCCRQGEHLDARALSCEKDPELHGVAEDAAAKGDLEEIRFLADASAEGWLPPELRRARVPVRFLDAEGRQTLLGAPGRQAFSARYAAVWEIETFDFEVPKLSLTVATPSGGSVVARANRFCIDVVRSGPLAPRVLIADVCGVPGYDCLPKCCPAGELLSARGRCRPHGLPAQPDWTPLASALNASLPDNGGHGGRALDNPLCWNYRFTLEPVPSSAADFKQRLTNNQERHRFLTRYYCADYIENGNDVLETLAYCNMPPSGPLYEMVRPLQVVAALLLAVSVASLLSRADTRSSTHGRALAAHAACLAASNGLQAFWFFSHNAAHCEAFAFSIYFFLVAAGFWLHVVSLNMARGFARVRGRPALRADGAVRLGRRRAAHGRRHQRLPLQGARAALAHAALLLRDAHLLRGKRLHHRRCGARGRRVGRAGLLLRAHGPAGGGQRRVPGLHGRAHPPPAPGRVGAAARGRRQTRRPVAGRAIGGAVREAAGERGAAGAAAGGHRVGGAHAALPWPAQPGALLLPAQRLRLRDRRDVGGPGARRGSELAVPLALQQPGRQRGDSGGSGGGRGSAVAVAAQVEDESSSAGRQRKDARRAGLPRRQGVQELRRPAVKWTRRCRITRQSEEITRE